MYCLMTSDRYNQRNATKVQRPIASFLISHLCWSLSALKSDRILETRTLMGEPIELQTDSLLATT